MAKEKETKAKTKEKEQPKQKLNDETEPCFKYFNEICTEDEEACINILTSASMTIFEQTRVRFDDPRVLGVTFSKTFEEILDILEEYTAKKSSMNIHLVNTNIGFKSIDTDTDEKEGNLMFYIIPETWKKIKESREYRASAKELCTQFITENVTESSDIIMKIGNRAVEALKKIEVNTNYYQFIIPSFVYTMETLMNYIQIRRKELNRFEHEINFLGCFYCYCVETADGNEIGFRPSIMSKLKIKNDAIASAPLDK